MLSHRLRSLVVVCLLVFGATAIAQAQTLERVKSRGRLVCGVNNALPGFGYIESDGSWSGFDVDFCRAIAAAVLGESRSGGVCPSLRCPAQRAIPTRVKSTSSFATPRGHCARDTEWTADFAPTTFYDGQGFMVRKDLGVAELEDLAGASICVTRGTTTELNLADTMRARGIPFTAVVFEEVDTVYKRV